MKRSERRALGCALLSAGLGATLFGLQWVRGEVSDARAYLAAFGFAFTTVLGGLGLLMISYVVGARWFIVLRRLTEALASTLIGVGLGFVPLVLLRRAIYPWAQAAQGKELFNQTRRVLGQPWLATPWFVLRGLLCLLLWIGCAELLRYWSLLDDRRGSATTSLRSALSAAGIPLICVTGTLATYDWLMSAVPGWNMTGVGLYVLTGGFAAAVGAVAVCLFFAVRHRALPAEVGAAHAHALGRLLLSGVCLWAYLAASQLIIVWSANIPRESAFYISRRAGQWQNFCWLLLFGHFVAPFLLLLSRPLKRRVGLVAALGAWLVLMHAVDLYWLIVPRPERPPRWTDLGPFLLLGGVLFFFGTVRFFAAPALPGADPELERSLHYESP